VSRRFTLLNSGGLCFITPVVQVSRDLATIAQSATGGGTVDAVSDAEPTGAHVLLPRAGSALERAGYGALIVQFAIKDFKIRYTHSLLGYAWSVLNPLMFFILYYLVFTVFVHLDIPNYPGFLLLGIVLWNFFEEGTGRGATALVERANLLSKTPMPRAVVVYSALLSAGLTFVINLAVLTVVLRITGTPLRIPAVCLPLLLADLVLLTTGTALFLAPLQVRFRDIGYLWRIMLQVGFWLTPIIYLDLMVPERWRWLVWVNPVGRVIGDSRRALIYGFWPGLRGLVLTTLMSIGVCVAGFTVFRRLQARIVEYF
jgi:ABC-type polysaccharide/polyol phosphate export permease